MEHLKKFGSSKLRFVRVGYALFLVHSNRKKILLFLRLGALGFLMWNNIEEGQDHNGNWGINDQTAALQWVQV